MGEAGCVQSRAASRGTRIMGADASEELSDRMPDFRPVLSLVSAENPAAFSAEFHVVGMDHAANTGKSGRVSREQQDEYLSRNEIAVPRLRDLAREMRWAHQELRRCAPGEWIRHEVPTPITARPSEVSAIHPPLPGYGPCPGRFARQRLAALPSGYIR